ncbi:helix-turn-helix transcriptional regulator [Paenibacillus sp. GCM10012307]|uniref:HTH domain-containing protein n=1 Tax=Paenibacillus roseus TaxID=2798579 RepID=A0A934J6F7_9BACL|nr:WYL domain-containing protein [Paenibacillus roseus]MBJ6363750.1 HTH domain-containing protein [Paenibacillus roseus]
MKRSDRLMAIVLALGQHKETAASLADKLEVSRRTILRDIQSLTELGVPVYALNGVKGGYRLMEGYTLPPLQLDTNEALTLLLSLDSMTAYADTPFNKERWTVMDKVKSILSPETLNKVAPLLKHMTVEVPRRSYTVPHLSRLMELTAQAKWVSVFYRSQSHQRTLLIRPQRIYAAHGFWYCETYSQIHREERLLRVDRMSQVEEAEPPPTLPDLPELGQDYVLQQDYVCEENSSGGLDASKRNFPALARTSFTLKAKLTYRGMLEVERDEHLGEKLVMIAEDEWLLEGELPVSEWDWTVRLFYFLGTDAYIIAPSALGEAVAIKARATLRHYSNTEKENRS